MAEFSELDERVLQRLVGKRIKAVEVRGTCIDIITEDECTHINTTTEQRSVQAYILLPAKKVMAFVDAVMAEESAGRPYHHWEPVDVQHAIFAAIVKWDGLFRSNSTTGMESTT